MAHLHPGCGIPGGNARPLGDAETEDCIKALPDSVLRLLSLAQMPFTGRTEPARRGNPRSGDNDTFPCGLRDAHISLGLHRT